MRIAIFADNFYPELSGIADSILTTGRELARRGHQVDFFVPAYSAKNFATGQVKQRELDLGPNITIHRLFSLPVPMPTLQGRLVFPNPLSGYFGAKDFDIIHTHSFWGPGWSAYWLAKRLKIPLIGTNHTLIESFSPLNNAWVKKMLAKYVIWFYRHCSLVSTPSTFLLNDMVAKGFDSTKIVAVSNPIDEEFFAEANRQQEIKSKYGLSPFTVLYVGRISPEKNVRSLVKAFSLFAKQTPDACLALIGQGTARLELKKLAVGSGLGDRIKFLGPYLGENKPKLYDLFHAADVFVMPSTSETQSMCTLQAMSAGLPVLAARAGALPELIGNDKGLIFEPDSGNEITALLARLHQNPAERDRLGQRGKRFAEQFQPRTIADRWEKIYAETAKNATAGFALKISLIIPAYNEEKYLGGCLDAALKHSGGHFYEIIVVDNNSTDRTREVAGQYPGVKVVFESQKGLTRARQRGLEEATGDLLAYIDADTRIPPGWFQIITDFFATRPAAVCLSGPYRYYDGSRRQNAILHALWRIYGPIAYRLVGYMVLGGNFVAKRRALIDMGGFDRRIEFYGEDTDIARRLHRLGRVVFRLDFFIYSSSRRFMAEGIWKSNFVYTMNFIWEVFFHRPFTKQYKDIRLELDKNGE